ncbi:unnamed protein product, partial [Coregonus sp. 'balchen']
MRSRRSMSVHIAVENSHTAAAEPSTWPSAPGNLLPKRPRKEKMARYCKDLIINRKAEPIFLVQQRGQQRQVPNHSKMLTALSLVRPFNSTQHQGSRMQNVKSHQQQPHNKEDEHPSSQCRERVSGPVTHSLQQN